MTMPFRFLLTSVAGVALVAGCVSPYEAHINGLNRAYAEGRISSREYRDELAGLEAADAAWHRSNADTAAAVATVGLVAAGTAAVIAASDYHHGYGHYYHHHHHGYCW
jgi:hypothetical protein